MSKQIRLIIADDESLIRMNLKETLTGLGYIVIGEAGDGASVIHQARLLRPDLVIMDIKMPKLDGIQAAKILTEENIAPVLLLTAYADQELVERAVVTAERDRLERGQGVGGMDKSDVRRGIDIVKRV